MNSEVDKFIQVYNNLFIYFEKYRKLKPEKKLTLEELKKNVISRGYVDINVDPLTERDESMLYRVLTRQATKEYTKEKQLNKIVNLIKKPLILIGWIKLSLAQEKLLERRNIIYYNAVRFSIVFPERLGAVKHEIVDYKEKFDPKSFPRISVKDVMCIWIGARKGDVIKITRLSETSCVSMAYRLVI